MESQQRAPLMRAGIVLGVGLGGFFDGIVFHQLLQWHHLLTSYDGGRFPMNTVRGLEVNTTWDGLFHSVTWIAVVVGLFLLWRLEHRYGARWSAVLVGALLMGWGGFNLVEGIVDYHILGIHHVRDDLGGPLGWDLAFLAWGALMLAGGWLLTRQVEQAESPAAMPNSPSDTRVPRVRRNSRRA